MNQESRDLHPAFGYWLIQLPGLILVASLAGLAANYELISNTTAILIFILWFIKELILYPVFVRTMWIYYPMGRDALLGCQGEVVSEITPEKPGQIRVSGEIWTARSVDNRSHKPGEAIVIFGVDGLTVFIKPAA